MLTVQSEVTVKGLTGQQITGFLLNCDDEAYQAWWPGTHLALHVLESGPTGDHVGDIVLMDEYIGTRRLRMAGEVITAIPGERVVWQLRLGRVRLPARLMLELSPREQGVHLRHIITAGWSGRGRVFDPLFRLYFTKSFVAALDRHVHTEFPLLRDAVGATTNPDRQ